MTILDAIKQSLNTLKSNKLRSFLSILSVVLGVLSIITVVSISNSTSNYINNQFQKLGSNSIAIKSMIKGTNEDYYLTQQDGEDLKLLIPEITSIQGICQFNGNLLFNDKQRPANVYGVEPQFSQFNTIEVSFGRFININDQTVGNNVVIISDSLSKKIFNTTQSIGNTVCLANDKGITNEFTIIGIYKSTAINDDAESNIDIPDDIFMPLSTSQQFFNSNYISILQFSVDGDIYKFREIGKKAIKALEFKHNVKDCFFASNSLDAKEKYMTLIKAITMIFMLIAAITLIVGGMGVINILLVSVTERYYEIGVIKAVGAKNSDIVKQFIIESTSITLFGGIIGITLGHICGIVISNLIDVPFYYDTKVIILSIFGVVILGIAFGVYPAYKAAKLDPISILRCE